MLVRLDDVPPREQDASAGWSISEFRLPLGAHNGSRSAVFHGRFRPGSRHSAHRHRGCDELCIYLRGRGLVGTGSDRYAVEAGDARLMPAGVAHFFHNAETRGEAEVLGLYLGAGSVEATGYELVGEISASDLARCERAGRDAAHEHPWTRAGEGALVDAPGWERTAYRELVAGAGASAFAATVAVGGGFAGTLDADTVLYVAAGAATADGAAVGPGQLWSAARGAALTLRNADPAHPLDLYGFTDQGPR